MKNVIPDTVIFIGNLRSFDQGTRNHLCERIPEMIDHIVNACRGKYTMTEFHTPTTYNDPAFIEEVFPYLEDVMGEENMVDLGTMSGAEDFSYISQQVPSAFVILGTGKEGAAPIHSPRMEQDEAVFKYGAALHAHVAMDWLKSKQSNL